MKTRPRSVVVTYTGYDWNQDDKIKAAFKMKGLSCDGAGTNFVGRDNFFYTKPSINLAELSAAIKRVRRWKYDGKKVTVSLYFDNE